jgi:membrane protein
VLRKLIVGWSSTPKKSFERRWASRLGSLVSMVEASISTSRVDTAILLGAELNAELERGRAIAAGHPPDEEPYMELRDTSKLRERDNL